MQATLLEKETIHAKFSVQVPAAEVDKTYNAIVREIARQVRVPGFRPGKAPRNIIEARVGKDAIADEVRDALVERFYPQALQELDLLKAVHADINKVHPVEGADYTFEVSVELYPEVALADVNEIVIDTEIPTVSDEAIQNTIDQLREENAVLIPVERPVEAGDYLLVRIASSPDADPMPVDLSKVEPEFAEQLLGKSIDEEVTLHVTVPRKEEAADEMTEGSDDEATEATDSTEADTTEALDTTVDDTVDSPEETPPETLTVVITDIKEKELPEADDEFAETLGLENWDTLLEQVRISLQAEMEREARSEQREELIGKLVENSQLELPPSMVSERKGQLLREVESDLQERGLDLKGYFEYLDNEGERDNFDKELAEKASEAVKRDLVLAELVGKRRPSMTEAELNSAIDMMARYQNTTPAKLRQQLGSQGLENYQFLLLRDKAVRETLAELLGENASEDAETTADTTNPVDAVEAAEAHPASADTEDQTESA
jgi:trigger factor